MPQLNTEAYRRALRKVGKPGGSVLDFIRLHARRKVSTTRQLADWVGYAEPRAINLQYGLFAERVGRALRFPYRWDDARLYSLVTFPPVPSGEEAKLLIREAFADALRKEGWL